MVILSPNPQHADLVADIHLVAQLSVNDELIEEVECPKSMHDGQWWPHFVTDLYVFHRKITWLHRESINIHRPTMVDRYRITAIESGSGVGPRVLGFVELTGAEGLASLLSHQFRPYSLSLSI